MPRRFCFDLVSASGVCRGAGDAVHFLLCDWTPSRKIVEMKATLEVINQMQADGIIGQYAIGGAVGATFYLEPVATLDIDVFISFQKSAGSPLLMLSPVYDYLTARGFKAEKEYIIIADWPVQFLPPGNALVEEALMQAVETEVEDDGGTSRRHRAANRTRKRFQPHPAVHRKRDD
jgi:hypothetical protein